MEKGIKLRFIIHNILYNIRKYNKTTDILFKHYKVAEYNQRDIAFINNVCLNTMRYFFFSKKILTKYVKKKPKLREEILLYSAITQIVYLDFKEYAVINSTVELAKKLKIYHGFVNAILKNICLDKLKLKKTKISFFDLPNWFREKTAGFSKEDKISFLNTFHDEPSLHLVFKDNEALNKFENKLFKTSSVSGFLIKSEKISDIKSYKKGSWWIQDFSSFFPLNNIDEKIISKKCLDICAAPGGKSFQILSKKKNLVLNDKSKKRIDLLKKNLGRLNFDPIILNFNFKDLNNKDKYDFIIVDAPCSSIGTIRKNPEIFFKERSPDLKNLTDIQSDLLNKSSKILNTNGIILYMVCSFFKSETIDQIENFLIRNSDFNLIKFYIKKEEIHSDIYIKKNFMLTLPNKIEKFNVDGFFGAYLKKVK